MLRNAAFVRLCAACFVYFAGIGIGIPVLPRFILGPAGGTTLQVGAAVAVFSVTSLVLRPFVAPAARRIPPPHLLAAGAVVVGAADGLLLLDPSPTAIVALRASAGLGEAMFFVLASAAVYDLAAPGRQGAAMGYFSALLSAGLLGSPVLGELLRARAGYDAVWGAALVLCLTAAALSLTLRLPRLPAARGGRTLLVHRAAIGPGLLLAANTWGGAAFATFTALYVSHLGLGGAALEYATFGVVLIGVRAGGAGLLDRVDPRAAAAAALALQSASLALFALAHSRGLLLVASALLAVGAAFAYPALMSLAAGAVPAAERTEAVATATACFDAGFALSSFGLAAALELHGFGAVYATAAVVMGVGAVAAACGRRMGRSPRSWGASP